MHHFRLKYYNSTYLRLFPKLVCFFFALFSFGGCYAQNLYLQLHTREGRADSIINTYAFKKSFMDFSSLDNELKHIGDTLYKQGYVDYRLTNLEKKSDTLYIGHLILGARLKKLHIYTTDPSVLFYAKKLNLPVTGDYFTIDPSEMENTFSRFTQLEAEAGYPLTYFQLKNLKHKDGYLTAELSHNREIKRTIDNITVKGYEKYPKSFVRHYANLKSGTPYDQGQILEHSNDLAQLPFLTSTRDPEVLFTRDSTSIFLYLQKRQANRFEGFLGFGTDERTGKIRFDGNLNLALINNLNFGESLQVAYKSDGNDQQNLNLTAELPFLFKSPLGVQLGLDLFRQDSTFSTSKQEAQLSYILSTRSRIHAGVAVESSTNLLTAENTTMAELSDYTKTLYGAGYGLAPQIKNRLLGISSEFNIYAALGKREAAGSQEIQTSTELNVTYTFQLNNKQQLYLSNTTKNLSSKTYFTNELFRFGGNKSIRGFQENSLLANFFTVFRTEYRYVPTNNLYVHTIFDAAYYENNIIKNEGYLYSFGFGAGILTNAGVLNFNIASGLQERQHFKFSDSIIHLEFTTFF